MGSGILLIYAGIFSYSDLIPTVCLVVCFHFFIWSLLLQTSGRTFLPRVGGPCPEFPTPSSWTSVAPHEQSTPRYELPPTPRISLFLHLVIKSYFGRRLPSSQHFFQGHGSQKLPTYLPFTPQPCPSHQMYPSTSPSSTPRQTRNKQKY